MTADLDRLEELARAATPAPWIRKWESLDVHWIGGDDALRGPSDIDYAVALVNAAPDLIAAVRIEAAARAMFDAERGVCVECGQVGDHEAPGADSFARECLTLPLRRALREARP